jgi:hypothetical protein
MLTTQQLSNVLETTQRTVLETTVELRTRNHELEKALTNLVALVDQTRIDSDGRWPERGDSCIKCTAGVFNEGLCPVHAAKKLLGLLSDTTPEWRRQELARKYGGPDSDGR